MKFYIASVIIHLMVFVLYFEMNLKKDILIKKEDKSITISLDGFQSIPQMKNKKDFLVKKEIFKKPNIQENKIAEKKEEAIVKKELMQNKIIEKSDIQQKKVIEKKEKSVVKNKINKDNVIERTIAKADTSIVKKTIVKNKIAKEKIIANQKMKGLKYKILYNPSPEYPKTARRMRIKKEIIINVRFLVNSKGNVEKVEIQKKDEYGFSKEVEKTLKKWKFSSIEFNGEKTSFYFYKRFKFSVKG